MIFFNQERKNNLCIEELHIRHLSLLIDLKNNENNNWFYKMAIINTFDDLKIFLSNLDKNKKKCIIAFQNNEIIGYVYTHPLNETKTCLKINGPKIFNNDYTVSRRELILKLFRSSIFNTDLKTSSWIINANINDAELISCSRELGFQPLKEIKLWKNQKEKNTFKNIFNNDLTQIDKSNIKKVLNFTRSNESLIFRNILDLTIEDIQKRIDNHTGIIISNETIIFTLLKDISYQNECVYSLIRGLCWDDRLNLSLKNVIKNILRKKSDIIFKTNSDDNKLNLYLKDIGLIEQDQEIMLVRNTLIKKDIKSVNKINKSLETIFERINPQGNPYPSPFPHK